MKNIGQSGTPALGHSKDLTAVARAWVERNAIHLLSGSLLFLAACSTRRETTPMPQDPAASWSGDSVLAPILRVPVLSAAQIAASDSIASVHDDFDVRLAAVATDTMAPPLIRSNAVLLLSDRRVPDLGTYLEVLNASDDRVRASGIVALRPFLSRWSSAMAAVKNALNDPSPLVQAKALEIMGDGNVDDLRAYASRAGNPDLRKIAQDLIRTAEERGEPLLPDSAGVLRRTTMTGQAISFKPTREWANWGVALGELHVAQPGKPAVRISDSVEVVRNVVPAFVSADGRYLVYEANRMIHVRDLTTGVDRPAASGIAPRVVPFTETFLFLREAPAEKVKQSGTIRYEVVQMPFASDSSKTIGKLDVQVKHDVNGHASPARWMRVSEADGKFAIVGELVETFSLPDPFAR